MFGLSPTEILIILAVALIFVGPSELPKVARTIGKSVAQVRGAMVKVDSEMRRAVREAASELDDDGEEVAPRAQVPEPEKTAAEPVANALPHDARDWSKVGKNPVAGQVASTPLTTPTPAPQGAEASPATQVVPTPPSA